MSTIQGTIKSSQTTRTEFVSVYFKVSGTAIVGNEWIQTEIPRTPAEGIIKRIRAYKVSGEANTLDFLVSEDNTMLMQDTVVKYEGVVLNSPNPPTQDSHLDSEEEIYYNLSERTDGDFNSGSMYVYAKCDTEENNIWYRLDVMIVG